MIEQVNQAKEQHADIILFPELSTIGYPAEDLFLRPSLKKRTENALTALSAVKDIVMVFGFVHHSDDGQRFNSAAVMKDGEILSEKMNQKNVNVFEKTKI
jgi:NAD+ synthase (glutamine-hydrolysing)